jgi:hypothetical protein
MTVAISAMQDLPILVGADDDAPSWGRTLDLGNLQIRVSTGYTTSDECAITTVLWPHE